MLWNGTGIIYFTALLFALLTTMKSPSPGWPPFDYWPFLLALLRCADKLIGKALQKAMAVRSTFSTSAITYMCVVLAGCSWTGAGFAEWARPPVQNLFPLLSDPLMKHSDISGSKDPIFASKNVLHLQQGHKLTHVSTEHLSVLSHSLPRLWALPPFQGLNH